MSTSTRKQGLATVSGAAVLLLAACSVRQASVPIVTVVVATVTDEPRPVVVDPTATPLPSPTPVPPVKQLADGGCCVQPFWSADSRQVLFVDKPAPDAPVGIYGVDIEAPGQPFRAYDLVGLYSGDFSHVAYPEGRDTIVEELDNGERWTIPNQGHEVLFSPNAARIAWEIEEIDGPYDQRRTDIFLARVTGEDAVSAATVYGGGLLGWLDENRLLFYGRPSLDVRERTLTALDTSSNIAVDLVAVERIGGVAISPDGSRVVYFISFNEDASRNGIWVQRTDGSDPVRLDWWGAYQWRDDSRLLYIPARDGPDRPFVIWEYDTETGQSRPVTDPAAAPMEIANGDWRVSPDGRFVVYVNSADRNLWLVELAP